MHVMPLTHVLGIGPVGARSLGKNFNSPVDLLRMFWYKCQRNEEEFAWHLRSFGIQYRWTKVTAAALNDWTNQHLASQVINWSFNVRVHIKGY